jgi:hypothetical protein
MESSVKLRKNPSRQTCEVMIKRILSAEVAQHGSNQYFKSAADFMSYFESLYPASDALTKQVQRAIKAMDMPKDENGYFVANKTVGEYEQEKAFSQAFSLANAHIDPMENIETIFLSVPPHMQAYMIHLFENTAIFQGQYLTIAPVSNGLLVYTDKKDDLISLLNSLTI